MMKSFWRGHVVYIKNGEYFYNDTKQPTFNNPRPCGYCDKENTKEGHDGCLGTLKGIMNACCGHGQNNEAYLQFLDGRIISGENAINNLLTNQRENQNGL